VTIETNIPLARFTTIGLGGAASFFVTCSSDADLRDALAHAHRERMRVHILGGGSNTIFADGGFPGLVIHASMTGLEFTERGAHVLVRAAAGEKWDPLVEACVSRGLGGLECLSGIPGLVGATPMQNVGAYGQEVADTILSVEALDRTTVTPVTIPGPQCGFGYRTSRFRREHADRYAITAVTFSLLPGATPSLRYPELRREVEQSVDLSALKSGQPALSAVRTAVLALRRSKSMVVDPADPESRSVGSFFTNPVVPPETFLVLEEGWKKSGSPGPVPHFPAGASVKIPAAWLVEHAGFPKGFSRGGVGVSRHHALALVNRGGTTADLLALANEIERAVHSRFGIRLEREPVILQ
jgi:UDP-N-acetylmuramate dehydrogenase